MEVNCFVCNKKTTEYQRNLTKIRSGFTDTPISQLIENLLDENHSKQNLHDESNCICPICLLELLEYDTNRVKANQQTQRLREKLLANGINDDVAPKNDRPQTADTNTVDDAHIDTADLIVVQTTTDNDEKSIVSTTLENTSHNLMSQRTTDRRTSDRQKKRKIENYTPPPKRQAVEKDNKSVRPKMKTRLNQSMPSLWSPAQPLDQTFQDKSTEKEQMPHDSESSSSHECVPCSKTFSRQSGLHRHNLTVHANKQQWYKCNGKDCDKMYKSESGFKNHRDRHHDSSTTYEIVHEEKTENSPNLSTSSNETIVSAIEQEIAIQQCTPCGKTFSNQYSLNRHKKTCRGEKQQQRYQCMANDCGKSYTTESNFNQHRNRHHDSSTTFEIVTDEKKGNSTQVTFDV
ncbi:zinc finger protein with KRAB and SCAN domains 1-like isoform X2 [Contarinia nasturtii]|uniref:zinc finger protein with KRAB and SCAN domains 1-like isoform X2 n=1 Tax=Contarinia nasturtii TaxID=265458 RepID=UPI0012D3778D|nr:zinc finger protein with KRAB and SCAN domains 1-like isoform X2 [Contarinia nasturtii]